MGPSLNSQYSHLVLPWTANHSTTWNARDAVYSIPVECCRFGALRTTLHERFSYASGLYFSKEAPTTSEALVLLLASVTVFILTRRLKIRKPSSWLTVTKRSFQDVSTKKEPAEVQPYQFPPLRPKTISCTSMGLRRLEQANWLTFDQHYLDEHTIRSSLLESSLSQVVQCLPISASACHETLSLVTSFLTSRYPSEYTIFDTSPPTIKVHITGEVFAIGPTCPNPLEIAARLAMEDFNILMKDPVSGEYSLEASATLFPAGWKLQERIGYSMEKLHGPVPDWQKNLGKSINRYFDHISSKTCMERSNVFIQTSPVLFQDSPEPVPAQPLKSADIYVRRERQTFVRLEKSQAVLFTVRTYMQPLEELRVEELNGLAQQVRSWNPVMARYKGIENWGDVTLKFCDAQAGATEEEDGA